MKRSESTNDAISSIFRVLHLAERLKFELRHSWLSNGRQESVAEHTWQMALMAIFMHRHLEHPINIEHVLKMVIIHDIIEAEAGDVPCFEIGPRKEAKAKNEQAAIEKIREMLGSQLGQEVYDTWQEFEMCETRDAKFAKALDNLEVQLQHNRANLGTWEEIEHELVYTKMDKYCSHDNFLTLFCQSVKSEAELKMQNGGINIADVHQRIAEKTHLCQ